MRISRKIVDSRKWKTKGRRVLKRDRQLSRATRGVFFFFFAFPPSLVLFVLRPNFISISRPPNASLQAPSFLNSFPFFFSSGVRAFAVSTRCGNFFESIALSDNNNSKLAFVRTSEPTFDSRSYFCGKLCLSFLFSTRTKAPDHRFFVRPRQSGFSHDLAGSRISM